MRKSIIILLGFVVTTFILYRQYYATQLTKPNISAIKLDLPIKRLEKEFFSLHTQNQIRQCLQDNPKFSQNFLGISNPHEESPIINQLDHLLHDPAMHELYQEVIHVFKDLTPIQQQLEQGFRYLRYYYPNVKVPDVVTFITGMGQDLYVDQDLIVIGLDFFLGENARFKPLNTPHYILRTYQPEYIAPKIFFRLAKYFQKNDPADHTLLHDMLAHGKAYYFTKALLPHVSDAIILGYTPEQLTDTEANEHIVWAHFIENELLYQTNPLIKKRYLGSRPFTAEIGPKCPGYIGGWLGWAIIKQYMERHPKTALSALMEYTDAQKLFTASKYRPKK